ncbi:MULTISPECIES: 50S ribosomal protein L2 [Metallosphaera]|uniref:Large ribosomal subunit protein uL2 n=3 Tax=Metallosphaera TaxID=41980 RepID=RL2_METS5|nr:MULTISPECIES: 50S ribosomal protein L2 [Metallosphaera]A4YCW9.1 RecName: Full=Large ribosomal subunit protein uL2; AltName: Full=50S ribosomal protein L2 [Metallosphaera sedula DSM 5348]ABP94271.1 LSU ribosomal protein L2P [Metallosphaera sedula DSM 5348]AIM26258.1 LSU ribosomal protein L2P [Metallosphaera sedula]AKV73274.1 50S ribosomal protein L2 [Metallosphaera sedula]AKV75518.1 50S ribosomal protein L2 [Metallosphaera sedula]AKV77764.1 50S ribosomal protein L2 [Metallosphaera sedula]
MGKKLLQQRAGRGNINFRNPGWLRVGKVRYPTITGHHIAKVVDILHNPGMTEPVAKVKLDTGIQFFIPAVQGLISGQKIEVGEGSPASLGNIVPAKDLPEGVYVSNVELHRGDGGRYARTAGSYAIVVGKSEGKVILRLPSGKIKEIDENALVTVGTVAGGGVLEKPLLKAGNNYWKYKVKATKWPDVRGVAMNVVSHPHGGGLHQSVSRSSTVARNTPPGRKVGHIAARRTGRRDRK